MKLHLWSQMVWLCRDVKTVTDPQTCTLKTFGRGIKKLFLITCSFFFFVVYPGEKTFFLNYWRLQRDIKLQQRNWNIFIKTRNADSHFDIYSKAEIQRKISFNITLWLKVYRNIWKTLVRIIIYKTAKHNLKISESHLKTSLFSLLFSRNYNNLLLEWKLSPLK